MTTWIAELFLASGSLTKKELGILQCAISSFAGQPLYDPDFMKSANVVRETRLCHADTREHTTVTSGKVLGPRSSVTGPYMHITAAPASTDGEKCLSVFLSLYVLRLWWWDLPRTLSAVFPVVVKVVKPSYVEAEDPSFHEEFRGSLPRILADCTAISSVCRTKSTPEGRRYTRWSSRRGQSFVTVIFLCVPVLLFFYDLPWRLRKSGKEVEGILVCFYCLPLPPHRRGGKISLLVAWPFRFPL